MKPRIAFYAPIKPPDHPIASGDREVARLTVRALEAAGHEVEIASRYIAYQKRPSRELFDRRRQGAEAEALRLKADWESRTANERPALWFTYHPYCKAPDWIGPAVSTQFDIPYATAEACRTGQATDADWAEARRQVQLAVDLASVNFCLKRSDLAYLRSFIADRRSIAPLTPFVDLSELDAMTAPDPVPAIPGDIPLLIAAGMMRPGAKTRSYIDLARALRRISDRPWNLAIIGDGPSRPEIEAAFSWARDHRLHWTGAVSRPALLDWFRRGDIFTWPGIREAIGMVFMEAQSQGLPAVAYRSLGAPLVVQHRHTGLLVPEGDIEAYAGALSALLEDKAGRDRMGKAAREYIGERHDISGAVDTFRETLGPLLD